MEIPDNNGLLESNPRRDGMDVRPLRSSEHDAAARLIHRSFVHWYETRLRQGARFGSTPDRFRIFPLVYATLDPGEAVAAVERDSGELLGLVFAHPRPSHVALGIVAVAPEARSRGVARALLDPIIAQARRNGRPVRLVSSLANVDSFSLYSRLGFVPHTLYQEMRLTVPAGGMAQLAPRPRADVRRVTDPRDAPHLAQLEAELQGLHREQDYRFILRNQVGKWCVWALGKTGERLEGFLVASLHPDYLMIGPGVARDEEAAGDLLWYGLDALAGQSSSFLVPAHASTLVRRCYGWGARNLELYAAQATAGGTRGQGVTFPTFLPETG